MKAGAQFASEADLCAAFTGWAREKGWTPYAETAGWDVLLVADKDGAQIGVQAKLRMNADVLTQALERHHYFTYARQGPDYRAVLVPDARGFGLICDCLGLTVITPRRSWERRTSSEAFSPPLPRGRDPYRNQFWHDQCPLERCALPDYVPDVIAGASAPVQLTDWKIKAIKLAILLEERGCVTRADFAHLQLSPTRWMTQGWLRYDPKRRGRFIAGQMPDFKAQHPRNFEEIRADQAKWAPISLIAQEKHNAQ